MFVLQTSATSYAGFLSIGQSVHSFALALNGNGHCSLFLDKTLASSPLLFTDASDRAQFVAHAESRMKHATSAVDFMEEVEDLLQRQQARHLQQPPHPQQQPSGIVANVDVMSALLASLEHDIGFENIEKIDDRLGHLHLVVTDAKKRRHLLEIAFVYHDSQSSATTTTTTTTTTTNIGGLSVTCSSVLPVQFKPLPKSSLAAIRTQFAAAVASFQRLFDVLDDIDALTWVLEPAFPTRASLMRRIYVGANVSLQVDLDPLAPWAIPQLRLSGPEKSVAPLREVLSTNLARWDELLLANGHSIRRCLVSLLQLQSFPVQQPADAASQGQAGEIDCGICYCYRLEHLPPDCLCDNCSKHFHNYCLYTYLRSTPNKTVAFNRISGSCPYCQSYVQCRVVHA